MCDLEINAGQAYMRKSNIEWISKTQTRVSMLKIEPNGQVKNCPVQRP